MHDVPDSGGLQLHVVERPIPRRISRASIPAGTRSVSVFLVNRRAAATTDAARPWPTSSSPSSRCACERPLRAAARPARGAGATDWDEQVADLHYADTPEYATGHGVSADWEIVDGACRVLRTALDPERRGREDRDGGRSPGVELSMEALGALADGAAARAALDPLVDAVPRLDRAAAGAARRAVPRARGARRPKSCCASPASPPTGSSAASTCSRRTPMRSTPSASPTARSPGRCSKRLDDRRSRAGGRSSSRSSCSTCPGSPTRATRTARSVDLLFFPTGGGKTEAYLGLAAFAMVLRRLRHPGEDGLAAPGSA